MLVAILVGAVISWLVARARGRADLEAERSGSVRVAADRDALRSRHTELIAELHDLRDRLENEQRARTAAETRFADVSELHAMLEESKRQLEATYSQLSQRALKGAIENLNEMVTPRLDKTESTITSNLVQRKTEFEAMLGPLREMLDSYRGELRKSEEKRSADYGSLGSQIENLLTAHQNLLSETGRLSSALTTPGTGGSWGENTLKRCVEVSGMSAYCDFDLQFTVQDSDGASLRPDMIVRLPEERVIAVDSKVPLKAYMAAYSSDDEAARKIELQKHARNVKRHIGLLSKKGYKDQIQSGTEKSLDFTILFMGSESALSAALTQDGELWDYASEKKIFLASPTILVPLLQALATGWKAEKMEENAERALETAGELYERFCKFAEHLAGVGAGIDASVAAWNSAARSFESRLEPKAKEVREILASKKEAAGIEALERERYSSDKLRALIDGADGPEPEEETFVRTEN